MKKSLGLTLIELLVVIAIIGLLIAIILPAIRGATDSAKTAACMNNLRQIYLGIRMYADDHDGRWDWFPGGIGGTMCVGSSIIWTAEGKAVGIGLLYPQYIDNPRVLWCPSNTKNRDTIENFGQPGKDSTSNYWTFAYASEILSPDCRLELLSKKIIVCDNSVDTDFIDANKGPHKGKYRGVCGNGAIVTLISYYGEDLTN